MGEKLPMRSSFFCWRPSILLLLTMNMATNFSVRAALVSRPHCKLLDSDLVVLEFIPETHQYVLSDDEEAHKENRFLRIREIHIWEAQKSTETAEPLTFPSKGTLTNSESNRGSFRAPRNRLKRHLQFGSSNTTTIKARLCRCADEEMFPDDAFYCPLDKAYCYIRRVGGEVIGNPSCVNETTQRALAKRVWPVALVMVALILILLLFSSHGNSAIDFCITAAYPKWNEFVARRILRRNPMRAAIMVRRGRDTYNENVEAHVARVSLSRLRTHRQQTQKLALRTKLYSMSDHTSSGKVSSKRSFHVDDDVVDGRTCSICFAVLNEGDRVGLLRCQHLFHVSCLKEWLRVRNVCPLCLHSDIAAPIAEDARPLPTSTTEQ